MGVAIGIVRSDSIEPSGVGCLNVSKGCHSSVNPGSRGGVCGSVATQIHGGGLLSSSFHVRFSSGFILPSGVIQATSF